MWRLKNEGDKSRKGEKGKKAPKKEMGPLFLWRYLVDFWVTLSRYHGINNQILTDYESFSVWYSRKLHDRTIMLRKRESFSL